MNIQKNAEDLKLFMFTVQKGIMSVNILEDFKAVLAYNEQDAINTVRKDYLVAMPLTIKKRAQLEVKKLVDVVEVTTPPTIPVAPPITHQIPIDPPPPVTREEKVQSFVNGLMLVADQFVTEKRDQVSLRRIIKKIKLNDEPA